MSAIAGLLHKDDFPVPPRSLEAMVALLAHRGPDARGVWSQAGVGLGHCMLHTTPESLHERYPLSSVDGKLVLVADARLDNRAELMAALGAHSHTPDVTTDGQLILAAYAKWEENSPEKLLGDFAFAIWDQRKQQVFCARDPMGVRPLYYYNSQRLFIFASEIKALFALPDLPRELNEERVADYLMRDFEDLSTTFYNQIFRLPAAHSLIVQRDQTRMRQYWTLDPHRELRLRSDSEYVEAFREIFAESVRCRLRSAFPVGAMLSGGLDSTAIACTARRGLTARPNDSLHTFSAIFPSLEKVDARIDERQYMEAVLGQNGFQPHYVRADQLSPLDTILWQGDEAIPAPNLYMDSALFRAAHQQGVRVLLSGFDGDTTVSHGCEYLMQLAGTGRWLTLLHEGTALSRRLHVSRRRLIWQLAIRPLLPTHALHPWARWREHRQLAALAINPSFVRRVRRRSGRQGDNTLRGVPLARKEHWRDLNSGLIRYALELLDKVAAPLALEIRYPFFDRRLMEFCLALPPAQKLHDGWSRWILRQAMEGDIPHQVRDRVHKGNLSANFRQRLLECERERLEDLMSNPAVIAEYVAVQELRSAYQRYAAQPLQREQDVLTVFLSVTLALWLRGSGLIPSAR